MDELINNLISGVIKILVILVVFFAIFVTFKYFEDRGYVSPEAENIVPQDTTFLDKVVYKVEKYVDRI